MSARPWMGASLRYANSDSLDMSWLPLPGGLSGFESRVVCVAVSGLAGPWERGMRVPHPIPVRSSIPEGSMGMQVCSIRRSSPGDAGMHT
jgi:hypothetical protein